MNIITSNNLSKFYPPKGLFRGSKTNALIDVSIACRNNEIYGIIGPNGAGKSTFLKILMGFIRPTSGVAAVANETAGSVAARRKIGFLPENPSLYPHLTAIEHLKFSCDVNGLNKFQREPIIAGILRMVSLEDDAKTQVKNFSKGMKQRLGLAFAMLHKPEILILDEPMSGLDPLGRQLVIDIIREANEQGATILFCSHILTDVERICDKIAILHKGQLLAEISPQDLQPVAPLYKDGNTSSSSSPLETFFLSTISEFNPCA